MLDEARVRLADAIAAERIAAGEAATLRLAALLDLDEAILDGEVIATDATGRPQFYELLRRTRAPAYVAFDTLWADGTDLRGLPLSERRQRS